MLSYMVPSVDDKPPPGVALNARLPQPRRTIIKTHSKSSTLSADSSASSISSVLSEVPPPNATDKQKQKNINGNPPKHPQLKRVSFGSSKGSMVETLIYETPLQEEPEPNDSSDSSSEKASKVKVSFFECDRPVQVSSPEPPQDLLYILDAPPCSMTEFARQTSTESGWENPFRPDGDLSREADQIVELIRVGKPITPLSGSPPVQLSGLKSDESGGGSDAGAGQVNGNAQPNGATPAAAAQLSSPQLKQAELHRSTAAPPAQPELVSIKKKPKSKCCVIQ